MAFVTRRRQCSQMRGRRPGKTGSVFAEYVEDCYGPRTRQMQADHSSQQNGMTRTFYWPGLFMNTCSVVRSCRPARLFSFGLLDGLPVRLRRPHARAASAGFRLERLATAFMNNPA